MADKHLIEQFGKRIRQLRKERNLSQEELSGSPPARGGASASDDEVVGAGFHRTYIGMVESAEHLLLKFLGAAILIYYSQINYALRSA